MKTKAVYTPAGGWAAAIAHARSICAERCDRQQAQAAIQETITALALGGDRHARLITAAEWSQRGHSLGSVSQSPPAVSLVKGRLGLIALPEIGTPPEAANSLNYVRGALKSIAALEVQHHPCGWIVDLRANLGGDMYPMLLSVGPILGAGKLIGFTGRAGFDDYVSYDHNALRGGGAVVQAPLKIPDFEPAPPVAVLMGYETASAGEAVAVAFRGRPETRSFGSATAGAMTAPQAFPLADGSFMFFAVVFYVDRSGTVYRHALTPDVSLGYFGPATSVAEKWLLSTAACAQNP